MGLRKTVWTKTGSIERSLTGGSDHRSLTGLAWWVLTAQACDFLSEKFFRCCEQPWHIVSVHLGSHTSEIRITTTATTKRNKHSHPVGTEAQGAVSSCGEVLAGW